MPVSTFPLQENDWSVPVPALVLNADVFDHPPVPFSNPPFSIRLYSPAHPPFSSCTASAYAIPLPSISICTVTLVLCVTVNTSETRI